MIIIIIGILVVPYTVRAASIRNKDLDSLFNNLSIGGVRGGFVGWSLRVQLGVLWRFIVGK